MSFVINDRFITRENDCKVGKQCLNVNKIDINYNPCHPDTSRIPVDTSIPAIDRFLKNEITVTKHAHVLYVIIGEIC